MSQPTPLELRELQIEYARFNAGRTLGTTSPSEFCVEQLGPVVLTMDAGRPQVSYYNRVFGMDQQSLANLGKIIDQFAAYGSLPELVVEPHELCEETSKALAQHGFLPHDSLAIMTRASDSPLHESAIHVERWEHDRADDFLALLKTSGVDCSKEVWDLRRELYCTDRFRTFVASVEGKPCAWATMFVDGDRGNLANAFTQPDFRGRGCQVSLIQARKADAAKLGLRWLASDVLFNTGSQRNLLRNGFHLQTVYTLWRRSEP